MKTTGYSSSSNIVKDKYQLLVKIGSGGMGDVFLCLQRGAVDFSRLVVLKAINENQTLYTNEHNWMFANEAKVIASLNHPHIVKIHDFFTTDESVFIAMEYVEGETLASIFNACQRRNQRIPLELSIHLLLDACDAIDYAHNATSPTGEKWEIIHRDIGLHNMMLDSNGYLKIIDFGIAKSNMQTDQTAPGIIKGNPAYMAPDLFFKSSPDRRIDIYALGLCLYELVTQTRAFRFGPHVTMGQIVREITTKLLAPPSWIRSDLPPGLDAIILKAITKERNDRYQTVQELANDLKNFANSLRMSHFDSRRWFHTNFAERLEERREFSARMLALAGNSGEYSEGLSPVQQERSIPQEQQGQPQPTRVERRLSQERKNTAFAWTPNDISIEKQTSTILKKQTSTSFPKLVSIFLTFLIGSLAVLYFFMTRENARGDYVPEAENLVVSCNPVGAMLTVDGIQIGRVGNGQLSLHVEPHEKHEVILSKNGYIEFVLPFVGSSTEVKRIDTTLKRIEPDAAKTPEGVEPDSEKTQGEIELDSANTSGEMEPDSAKIPGEIEPDIAKTQEEEAVAGDVPALGDIVQKDTLTKKRGRIRRFASPKKHKYSKRKRRFRKRRAKPRLDESSGPVDSIPKEIPPTTSPENETTLVEKRAFIPLLDDNKNKIPLVDD